MSLIHKALKKIEKEGSDPNSNIVLPEEGLISSPKKDFYATEVTPRTVGLIALTILAGVFAVYTNFCAEKGRKNIAVKPTASASQTAGQQQSPTPLQAAEVLPTVIGVTKSLQNAKKNQLPPDVAAINSEGENAFLSGRLDEAFAKFSEALTKSPDSSEILNSLGLVFKKKGDLAQAEKYYNQAIKVDPNCFECLNNLGVLKVDQNDNVSAVMYLKKAVAVSETYADPYFNLAVIMEKEGNYKSAVEYYKNFLKYTSSEDNELKAKIRTRIEELVLNWESND